MDFIEKSKSSNKGKPIREIGASLEIGGTRLAQASHKPSSNALIQDLRASSSPVPLSLSRLSDSIKLIQEENEKLKEVYANDKERLQRVYTCEATCTSLQTKLQHSVAESALQRKKKGGNTASIVCAVVGVIAGATAGVFLYQQNVLKL